MIVESPAKARTINKYLGRDYVVKASMGHIRDLPKGKFGIDLDHGFEPEYTTIRGKGKVISELKRLAKSAASVYLAPDMDREGEAIAWHLSGDRSDVDDKNLFRVVFNEITKKAIQDAFDEPGKLDMRQGRRPAGASRARPDHGLQAVAAALEEDRQGALRRPRPVGGGAADRRARARDPRVRERGVLARHRALRRWKGNEFQAELQALGETRIEKNLKEDEAKGPRRAHRLETPLELVELEVKPKTRRPTPPFTTSQLQQKASTMLRFSARKTMMIAQQLYEGIEVPGEGSVGLITYMRTDSVRVSNDALGQARDRDRVGLRQGLPAGQAQRLQAPSRRRRRKRTRRSAPRMLRTHSPDKLEKSLTDRSVQALQADLEQVRREPDEAGALRRHHGLVPLSRASTVQRQAGTTAAARFVAQGEVEVFDGHLRVFKIPRRSLRSRGAGVAGRLEKGESYKSRRRSIRPSTSPSRRRASPRPLWSRSSRRRASVALDLRHDHLDDPGSRLRDLGAASLRGHRARGDRHRPSWSSTSAT